MNSETIREKIEYILSKQSYNTDDLKVIMQILRSENGCPWDKEQNHKSIRNDFIEEAYEAVEAIDCEDAEHLCEELGDVLLQVVFHAEIAEEDKEFSLDDVTDGICKKLILRHPHVFGDVKVENVGDVLKNWDTIKQESKGQKTVGDVFDGVSRALPSLMRASKLVKRAEKANIPLPADEKEFEDMLNKYPENQRAEIVGKTLFAISAAARHNGINPEQALYDVCENFVKAENEKN